MIKLEDLKPGELYRHCYIGSKTAKYYYECFHVSKKIFVKDNDLIFITRQINEKEISNIQHLLGLECLYLALYKDKTVVIEPEDLNHLSKI